MTEEARKSRKASGKDRRRTRYSVGAQLTRAEHAQLEAEWQLRGCSPSELVRAALGLDDAVPLRPLLVAAGQLIRAGNAHAVAARADNWTAAAAGLDQLNAHAAELIRLAVQERTRR